ncbi:MAG TPA: SCO family protein, partial [Alphaproteobacteria bacterium]
MNHRKDHHIRHFTALAILAAVFLIGIYVWDGKHSGDSALYSAQDASALSPASGAEEVAIGAKWDLVDQTGKPVDQTSYPGKYKLVFFGFASCPDICPTTLQKISKAMDTLGKDADDVKALFITTDPANDKPAVMEKYVKQFGG